MKKVGVLFPGQGSQYVGMGKSLYEKFATVRELFKQADDASGAALTELIFNGPEDDLRRTFNTQPCILLASYAAWAVLEKETGIRPFMMAGHSLGEYTALAAGGLFSLADAVMLTRKRGLFMEEACPTGVGGMVALIGPNMAQVEEACSQISRDDYVAAPANLNSADQVVLSGNLEALKAVVEKLKGSGYKKAVFLNVSGPFHSPLMKPAADKLKAELLKVRLGDLAVPVVANVNATPNQDRAAVIDLLYTQMFSPVRWEASVKAMASAGVEIFLEVGPQKVLTNLVKRIAPDVPCHHVEEMEEIETVRGLIA